MSFKLKWKADIDQPINESRNRKPPMSMWKKKKYCSGANMVSKKVEGLFVVHFWKLLLVRLLNYIVFSFLISREPLWMMLLLESTELILTHLMKSGDSSPKLFSGKLFLQNKKTLRSHVKWPIYRIKVVYCERKFMNELIYNLIVNQNDQYKLRSF